jgi:uncharacterized protein YuzE
MKVRYDRDVDVVYIQFKEGPYDTSREIDGIVMDYDKSGGIMGIEILDASKKLNKEALSEMIFEVPA